MTVDLADRYLTATRFAAAQGQVKGPLADLYREYFHSCKRQLQLQDIELWITHSANQRVEILHGAGRPLVIYDQFLGQTFSRLSKFVLTDPGPDAVLAFALGRATLELASLGSRREAAIAAIASLRFKMTASTPTESRQKHLIRGLQVQIQEFFVIAHECAHVAILGGRLSLKEAGWLELVKEAAGQFDARHDVTQVEMIEKAVSDHLAALGHGGETASPELRDAVESYWSDLNQGSLVSQIEATPHLAEELFCDHIASLLTLRHFAPADERAVFPSILLGLHNLATREYICGLAHRIAGNSLGAQELNSVARKSIFRAMSLLHLEAGNQHDVADHVRQDFVSVSEGHAASVGDCVLFRLPYELDTALERIDEAEMPLDDATIAKLIASQVKRP